MKNTPSRVPRKGWGGEERYLKNSKVRRYFCQKRYDRVIREAQNSSTLISRYYVDDRHLTWEKHFCISEIE